MTAKAAPAAQAAAAAALLCDAPLEVSPAHFEATAAATADASATAAAFGALQNPSKLPPAETIVEPALTDSNAAASPSSPSSPSRSQSYAPPRGMVASMPFNVRFEKLIRGHWLDSIGNSIIVSRYTEDQQLTAVLTPLIDHPEAKDRVFTIKRDNSRTWRCGNANLEWADEQQQRLVWVTEDGRRSVWSRTAANDQVMSTPDGIAFPWLLNNSVPEPWLPLDVPRDILYDGARVSALLDIRQMIGPRSDPQERLTHILMDHDLHPMRGDYLIPGAESPLWQTLPVSESMRQDIAQRIHRIPHEALSQRVSWNGETEVWVGHHKISCRPRDIQALESRWVLPPKDERKPLEIARLLALYSVFDNPLSNRRSGLHLGLDPSLRTQCDYELFASPLNATVSNGHFASKWPHIEWRFGSIGSYPSVLQILPVNAVVCVNPPFTEAYLADVMARLGELKLRFRLRIAVPIQEASWRRKLLSSLPSAHLLRTYYDASSDNSVDVLHPTILWEDPRCATDHSHAQEAPATNGRSNGILVADFVTPLQPDPNVGQAAVMSVVAASSAPAASQGEPSATAEVSWGQLQPSSATSPDVSFDATAAPALGPSNTALLPPAASPVAEEAQSAASALFDAASAAASGLTGRGQLVGEPASAATGPGQMQLGETCEGERAPHNRRPLPPRETSGPREALRDNQEGAVGVHQPSQEPCKADEGHKEKPAEAAAAKPREKKPAEALAAKPPRRSAPKPAEPAQKTAEPAPKPDEEESPVLDADEWPSLSMTKVSKKGAKLKR